jgi:hypothetical protein
MRTYYEILDEKVWEQRLMGGQPHKEQARREILKVITLIMIGFFFWGLTENFINYKTALNILGLGFALASLYMIRKFIHLQKYGN